MLVPKPQANRQLRYYLIVLAYFNGYVFANGYFFNFKLPMSFWVFVPTAIVISILPWLIADISGGKKTITKQIAKKILTYVVLIVVMLVTLYLSALAPMFTPGSREHNYVMYKICLPALRKRYDSWPVEKRPNYFDVHQKCEQNVWAGREPLDE